MTLQELHDLVTQASEGVGTVLVPFHLLGKIQETQTDLITIRGRLRRLLLDAKYVHDRVSQDGEEA